MNVVIINYGMGNVKSIKNQLARMSFNSIISSKENDIEKADKIILPGVGHFDAGMKNILANNLFDILTYKVVEKNTPILGICLGMQLFCDASEEGKTNGFGWLKGKVIKFQINNTKYKIPHIGWNNLNIKNNSKLLKDINEKNYFYFAHSYYLSDVKEKNILAYTSYSFEFISSVRKGNIFGTQFHPEKSHQSGIKILKNFLEI